jgi:hypothetical protein
MTVDFNFKFDYSTLADNAMALSTFKTSVFASAAANCGLPLSSASLRSLGYTTFQGVNSTYMSVDFTFPSSYTDAQITSAAKAIVTANCSGFPSNLNCTGIGGNDQIFPKKTTVAGSYNNGLSSGDGGLATAARLGVVTSIAIDPSTTNIFLADTDLYGVSRIRVIYSSTGIIWTMAGGGLRTTGGLQEEVGEVQHGYETALIDV